MARMPGAAWRGTARYGALRRGATPRRTLIHGTVRDVENIRG